MAVAVATVVHNAHLLRLACEEQERQGCRTVGACGRRADNWVRHGLFESSMVQEDT